MSIEQSNVAKTLSYTPPERYTAPGTATYSTDVGSRSTTKFEMVTCNLQVLQTATDLGSFICCKYGGEATNLLDWIDVDKINAPRLTTP
jgi:hypothetical protein